MSAASKESDEECETAGTSSMMESTMMEGEEYYHPETTVAWTEKARGSDQLCRICANANEYLIPIFSGEGLEHQLGMKIEKHLPIQVVNQDKLPLHVCYQCASTLIAWHDLHMGCVEAEKKLRQMFQQREEEAEHDSDDDDRADDFYSEPMESEMTEDPLEPSTSEAAKPTRLSRSPRKKTATKAKPKLKLTLVKTPVAILPKSLPKLLQPKEEQTDPDPASERIVAATPATYSIWIQTEDHQQEYHLCDVKQEVTSTKMKITPRSQHKDLRRSRSIRVVLYKCLRSMSGRYRLKRSYICGSWQCSVCDKTFNSRALLRTHGRFHSDIRPFYCKHCRARFKLSGSLMCHISRCLKNEHAVVLKHPRTTGVKKLFKCSVCFNTFTLRATLKDHLLGHIGKSRMRFKCHMCEQRFRHKSELVAHVTSHGQAEMHECAECHLLFLSVSDLRVHQVIHSDVRPFKCTVCQASYKRNSHLRRHVATHDTSGKQPRVYRPRRKDGVAKPTLSCSVCNKQCKSLNLLKQHVMTHTSERAHTCTVCGAQFRQRGGMRRHVATVHEGARKFVCEVCGQSFTAKATVTAHMLIHTGERPHVCAQCGKRFRTLQQLACHGAMHSEARPHACKSCNKTFRRLRNLQVHERTHTGEKPYPCQQCGRSFAQKGDMMKHSLIHFR